MSDSTYTYCYGHQADMGKKGNNNVKLADSFIRRVPPPATGNKVWYDTDVSGFGIRVTARGAKAFVLTTARRAESSTATRSAPGRHGRQPRLAGKRTGCENLSRKAGTRWPTIRPSARRRRWAT